MSANAVKTAPKTDNSPRIRTRVLWFFGLALVFLLVVMSITIFTLVSTNEAEQWQGRQVEASVSSVFRVQSFFETSKGELELVEKFAISQENSDILVEIITEYPQFLELVFVDATGKVINNHFQDAPLLGNQVTIQQANWFKAAIEDTTREIYISPIQLSTDNQPYLIMSLATEGFDGVVAARISLSVFSDVISQLTFGETGQAYVVGNDGFILAHTDDNVVTANLNIADREEYQRALFRPIDTTVDQSLGNSSTESYNNFLEIPVVGTAERIPDLDWVLFTEVEQAEVFKATGQAITILVVVTLVVFVLTLAVVSEVQRRLIFTPLAELRSNVEKVSTGDFNVSFKTPRRDEIGEVSQTFNDMVRIVGERSIERERLIRELQAAKRLAEENSRLKSEFLSTMSHELRTPMNAIEGFVGIILSRMGGTDYNEKTSTYLLRVRANSQRLLALINDFLDLSRVESGRLDLASQPFEPEKLAQRWRSELGVLAESKQIDFELQIDPDLPKTLIGDEEAISKVVINLIGNAIKFTEKGKVTVALEAMDKEWNIIVRDTGIGIPPHAREFVFEEFRQVDQSSRRKYGGTGLGLAIVQKYTRSMGGQVTLKSEVGQGSEFTVTLPIVTAQQAKKAKEA